MASGGKKMTITSKKTERKSVSFTVKNSTNPKHSSQDVTKLKLLNESLSAENAGLQKSKTDLIRDLDTKDYILEKKREQVALLEEDISSLKAQIRKKEEEISGLERKLQESIDELEEHNERNDTMRAGSEKEAEILKEEINRLKKEVESSEKKLLAAKESRQKSESEKEMIKLREAVENNNQELANTKQELASTNKKLDVVLDLLKGVPKDRGLGGKPSEEQVCQSKNTPLIKRPLKVPDNVSGRRMWKPTGKVTPGFNKPIGVSPKMDKPQMTTSKTLPGIQPKK